MFYLFVNKVVHVATDKFVIGHPCQAFDLILNIYTNSNIPCDYMLAFTHGFVNNFPDFI